MWRTDAHDLRLLDMQRFCWMSKGKRFGLLEALYIIQRPIVGRTAVAMSHWLCCVPVASVVAVLCLSSMFTENEEKYDGL